MPSSSGLGEFPGGGAKGFEQLPRWTYLIVIMEVPGGSKELTTAAIKAAVMTKDLARTVWYVLQPGTPDEIAPEVLPNSITATPMCTGNKRARCGIRRWSTNRSARAQDTTREASRYDRP
jgi:hypothetical protein